MKLRNRLKLIQQKLFHPCPDFQCPICDYLGPFVVTNNRYLGRRYASSCPSCGAKERHRLEAVVLKRILSNTDVSNWTVVHFAPEAHLRRMIESRVLEYIASDYSDNEQLRLDITRLDLGDEFCHCVVANHVLEHVPDERKALKEIHRILKPGGIALLPVPIYAEKTIEYGEPLECSDHWRAPGPDYFDRLKDVFPQVDVTDSHDAPAEIQPYLLECRNHWPTKGAPRVLPMNGFIFKEYIPVVRK